MNLALDAGEVGCKGGWKTLTTSCWFIQFMTGLNTRIVHIQRHSLALSVGLIVGIERSIREDIKMSTDKEERFQLMLFGDYLVISYVLSLRGNEGLMLDVSRLVE